jgi:predicted nucleic acid-binding protein
VIVVDASVAVKWVLHEDGETQAAALLRESMAAPSIWLVEAANALWRIERQGRLSPEEADEALAKLRRAPVTLAEPDPALALTLARELRHPVYDCFYLALAIERDLSVVTADTRFVHAAAQTVHAGRVRLLIA